MIALKPLSFRRLYDKCSLCVKRSLAVRSLFAVKCFLVVFATVPALSAKAINYGIYDARALGMGGAVTAVGNATQAAYYNPALLALPRSSGDQASDRRLYLPGLVAQASTAVDSALDAVNNNIDRELSNALRAFNTQKTADNAGLVAISSQDLHRVLDRIANKDLRVDGFIGVSTHELDDRAGGAFYAGVRTVGVGTSTISAADVALLDEYIAAMGEIANGASPLMIAMQHPNLIGANGQFSDPTSKLTSAAEVSGLVIGEWGLSLAREFSPWEHPVVFGLTPKLMRVDSYRERAEFNNTDIRSIDQGINDLANTKNSLTTFNADFGVATLVAERYRVGFAIKDVFTKRFITRHPTGPDHVIKLRPRSRLGLGYSGDNFTLGLDYDLQKTTTIASESGSQELSLGGEYTTLNNLALRLGYRHDQVGAVGDIISTGIGYSGQRFIADLAYSHGRDMKGASLQMGWTF